jgi:hypothetical protein
MALEQIQTAELVDRKVQAESRAMPYPVLALVACLSQEGVVEVDLVGLQNRCPRRPMGHSRVVCEVQHYSIFCGFVIKMIQLSTIL